MVQKKADKNSTSYPDYILTHKNNNYQRMQDDDPGLPIPSCIMLYLLYLITYLLLFGDLTFQSFVFPFHTFCVVNEKSSHAALVLWAATASQLLCAAPVWLPLCRSLSSPFSSFSSSSSPLCSIYRLHLQRGCSVQFLKAAAVVEWLIQCGEQLSWGGFIKIRNCRLLTLSSFS